MHPQGTIEDSESSSSPSFNCYASESSTSRSIAKIIHEDQDFEFAFLVTDQDALSNSNDDETDASFALTGPLGKLFIDESFSYTYTSSEADELENLPSETYCVWRPKGSSPAMTKCKKSSSTGSGSKRWRFRYLLRRSNSEGKEPMVLLTSKKEKRNSGEVSKVAGPWKVQTPVHEQFYVQRRAENEVGKRKSYLPYRKDLVGLFANVNGMGKMLPF
ncbi:uncharacterized protein LOC143593150 [Bidens hawaiensis]|uniref:uncharacterized protein LOC143593150 n=1 Tax=Bidens hawaiensis TaxID=980011 RepID=UPI00404AB3F5